MISAGNALDTCTHNKNMVLYKSLLATYTANFVYSVVLRMLANTLLHKESFISLLPDVLIVRHLEDYK